MGQGLQWVWLQGRIHLRWWGTRVEDLVEVERFAEVDGGGIFRKLRKTGSEGRMWKPSQRISLSFGRPR